jgi:hypothetical protein
MATEATGLALTPTEYIAEHLQNLNLQLQEESLKLKKVFVSF